MFTGQYQIAKLTALELRAQLPLTTTDDYLPMLDFLEMFIAVPLHVMVRFGRWYDILAEPLPAVAGSDDNRFSATLAVQRYARAVALAALGRVGEAEAEAEAFELAKARVPESRKHLIYNTYADVLGVAQSMLQGEIACESAAACVSPFSLLSLLACQKRTCCPDRKGDVGEAFRLLREAVARDAALSYEEPCK